MKKKTQAFTLAEALILLLIAALLAAALVPVITRKHKDVGEHGEWTCTLNKDGKHVVKTTYRGKVTEFELAQGNGEYCVFSPPAAAKNFTIKAVGGGGGGAGGTMGNVSSIYDSRVDGPTYAGTVDVDSTYNVIIAGGGGGGGGMACGEAKDQITNDLDLEQDSVFETQSEKHHGMYGQGNDWSWNESTQQHDKASPVSWCPKTSSIGYDVDCRSSENSKSEDPNHPKYYQYGYVDHMLPGFKYNLLFQNDQKYTDEYNYGQNKPDTRYTNENGEWAGNISVYDFKYKYLAYDEIGLDEQQLKDRVMCFAENDWPMSKEINGDKGLYLTDKDASKPSIKCWNLPGQGGHQGQAESAIDSEELMAGESIYAMVGNPGYGKQTGNKRTVSAFLPNSSGVLTLTTRMSSDGDVGTKGEETILQLGGRKYTAEGGEGGASRFLKEIPAYKNIPVYECEVYPIESSGFLDEPTAAAGKDGTVTTSPSFCTNTPHSTCSAPTYCVDWVSKTCKHPDTTDEDGNTIPGSSYDCSYCADTVQHYKCSCSKHTGISSYGLRNCVQRVRPKYFDATHKKLGINVCIYSSAVLEGENPKLPDGDRKNPAPLFGNTIADIDFPYLNPEIKPYTPEADEEDQYYLEGGRQRYMGQAGSGGYGAGETSRTYIAFNDQTGEAFANFIGNEGTEGYIAIVRSDAYGGTGGQAGQYVSTMVKKLAKLKITIGAPGAPSIIQTDGHPGYPTIIQEFDTESNSYKDMFVLQGGIAGQAKKLTAMATAEVVKGGDGAPSPVENEANRAKIIPYGGYSGDGANTNYAGKTAITSVWGQSGTILNGAAYSFNTIGGHPLDMTYGAGGGGGAGGTSTAGGGAAGTPGVVIIKW